MNIKKYLHFKREMGIAHIPMNPIAGLNPWVFTVIFSLLSVAINIYLYMTGLAGIGIVSTMGVSIIIFTPIIKSALLELSTKLAKVSTMGWQRAFFVSGVTMFIGALFQLGLAVLVLNSSQQKIYVIAVSLAVIIASFFVTKKVYNISYLRTVIVGLVFVALAVVFAMIVLKIGLPVALFFSKH